MYRNPGRGSSLESVQRDKRGQRSRMPLSGRQDVCWEGSLPDSGAVHAGPSPPQWRLMMDQPRKMEQDGVEVQQEAGKWPTDTQQDMSRMCEKDRVV